MDIPEDVIYAAVAAIENAPTDEQGFLDQAQVFIEWARKQTLAEVLKAAEENRVILKTVHRGYTVESFGDPLVRISVLRALDTTPDQGCKVPPLGWWCSREPGHDGPCAARPKGGE